MAATDSFVPAIHELVRAMHAIVQLGGIDQVTPLIYHLRGSPHYRRKAVKYWLDWLCAGSTELLQDFEIREAVFASDVRTQARAALASRDLAWVRAQRANYIQLPPMQRSAVIMSMQLLGNDERRHILHPIDGPNSSPVDIAVKRMVMQT
jgi:hypothetical protein